MFFKAIVVFLSMFLLSGCSMTTRKSGLEVVSYPPAKIYINNKESGTTPYKNVNLKPGEVTVKLVSSDNKQWIKKLELQNNVSTFINWEFGSQDKESGGYVLYLEKTGDPKKAGVMINALPDKSAVKIDGEIKGYSPIRFNDIGSGDKQLSLTYPGHKNINVFMKAVNGYQLVVDAKLAKEAIVITQDIPEVSTENNINTPALQQKSVIIKETETGWLRVRKEASSDSMEITKVKPGEKYNLLEETADWIKIDLGNDISGWISSSYAKKSE